MPSISRCGLPSISRRSLNVPGSISSPLATRYFRWGASSPMGTKLHFCPVGNPAPPRPRRFESFTTCCTSAGVIPPSALRSAWYPPALSYSCRVSACPSERRSPVSGRSELRILLQDCVYLLRRQIAVKVVVHHHDRRAIAGAQANDGQQGESAIRGRFAQRDAQAGRHGVAHGLVAHDPTTHAVADEDHVPSHRLPEDQVVERRHAVQLGRGHPEELADIPQPFVGDPPTVVLDHLERLDTDGPPVVVVLHLGFDLSPLFVAQHSLIPVKHRLERPGLQMYISTCPHPTPRSRGCPGWT